jgi:hypothetical protein
MTSAELIEALGYSESRRFITPEKTGNLPDGELSFAFRRLTERRVEDGVQFHGAYMLQNDPGILSNEEGCLERRRCDWEIVIREAGN